MRIRTRFNIVLTTVFALGFAACALVAHYVLVDNAKQDVRRNANLLMETAMSVRAYTVEQIKPHLDPMLEQEFLPQTVPAFAAVETFDRLRTKYPEFSYREATLNPTNPRDRAVPWEQEIVERFRDGSATSDVVGERIGERGPTLYIARPIRITNPQCLACHTSPQAAPASLVAKYGTEGGFGWRLDEVVGAQIISVPMSLPVHNAQRAFYAFLAVLGGLFVILFLLINLMLSRLIVKPIERVCELSDMVSRGHLDLPEFEERGAAEIARLHAAFNRMRRSIEKAMRVLHAQQATGKRD